MKTLSAISYAILAMVAIKFINDVVRAEPTLRRLPQRSAAVGLPQVTAILTRYAAAQQNNRPCSDPIGLRVQAHRGVLRLQC